MASKLILRDYNSSEALASGVVTYSSVADPSDMIAHDIRELCGLSKKAWAELNDYTRWSLMRDANNTLGDSFASDAGMFKESSTAKFVKFVAGIFTKGGGGGSASAGMNDYIRALMRVAGLDEDGARQYIAELETEVKQENGFTEYEDFKRHQQIKDARKAISFERAQVALEANKDKEVVPFELKK